MPDVLYLGEGAQLREMKNSASLRYNHGDCGNGGTVWTKVKLFQFVENYRPAYYGTWRRRSFAITGRRPLAKDRLQLDYEVDSDDEWEEEEPGESITQSEVSYTRTYRNLFMKFVLYNLLSWSSNSVLMCTFA